MREARRLPKCKFYKRTTDMFAFQRRAIISYRASETRRVFLYGKGRQRQIIHEQVFLGSISFGEQGWCSGESTCLSPMLLRLDSRTQLHIWVEFVVGSRPCFERFFSGYTGFPLSTKTSISKFQFDPESEGHRFVSGNRLLGVILVQQSLFILFYTDNLN